MSEIESASIEDSARAQESSGQLSGGAMLRRAREAVGLHIGALAVSLKVPVKKLEALEADRFDLLPDTVFVRALASSVCRTLKIDPGPILERLPHTTVPRLKTDASGINVPFHASGGGSGMLFWDQLSKPVGLAVLALLVGVLALVFFPFAERGVLVTAPKSDATIVTSPPVELLLAVPSPDLAASGSVSAPTPLAVPAGSAEALSAVAGAAMPVMVPGSGATTGLIIIKAHGTSWVEIVDASGVVQVRKTMVDGEIVGASGAVPLSVVVGRADTTEVHVRGAPFDLAPVVKDNVARFEVK